VPTAGATNWWPFFIAIAPIERCMMTPIERCKRYAMAPIERYAMAPVVRRRNMHATCLKISNNCNGLEDGSG
jgi:hypothetical protein